jgi:hypothetical protein
MFRPVDCQEQVPILGEEERVCVEGSGSCFLFIKTPADLWGNFMCPIQED